MSLDDAELQGPDIEGKGKAEDAALSRRAFILIGAAGTFGLATAWVMNSMSTTDGLPKLLRKGFDLNSGFWRSVRRPSGSAPTYSLTDVQKPRFKGGTGLATSDDHTDWRLRLEGLEGQQDMQLTLDEIKSLPRVEFVTELFCISGWSVITHWIGARLSDLVAKYPPIAGAKHVGLETPGGEFCVGLDMASAIHHQTLLCYGMNGQPLTLMHGAPLRVVVPIKYGLKSLKNLGRLTYSQERPRDSWVETGYDYDCGL